MAVVQSLRTLPTGSRGYSNRSFTAMHCHAPSRHGWLVIDYIPSAEDHRTGEYRDRGRPELIVKMLSHGSAVRQIFHLAALCSCAAGTASGKNLTRPPDTLRCWPEEETQNGIRTKPGKSPS